MASISMMTISITTISITTIVSISIGISTTLATGNMLEGVSSWVKLVDSVNSSIVRKTKRNSMESISIKSITRFSISTTLAKFLGRSGNKGGGGTGMSGNTKTMSIETMSMETITISTGIAISIGKVSWLSISLSISATLAVVEGRTATKTGGGRVRGGHSWPVRVGIEQGRGTDQVAWVSRGGGGHGQTGGNQKLRHV